MDEAERRKRADGELRRRGLILDDPEVVEAMESPGEEGLRFLPLRVSGRTGAITGDALVSAERLGRLKVHTQHILREIARELSAGNIAADPFSVSYTHLDVYKRQGMCRATGKRESRDLTRRSPCPLLTSPETGRKIGQILLTAQEY